MTIEEYWRWWEDARDDVQAAIETGGRRRARSCTSCSGRSPPWGSCARCRPGSSARHAICASANGDPALRKLAYRWRDAGPPPDEVFEYHASRIAGDLDATLRMN